jgi:hypothetical protein
LSKLRDQIVAASALDIKNSGLETMFALDASRATLLSEELSALAEDPTLFDEQVQERLAEEVSTWFSELLSGPQGHGGGGATLYRLLQHTPTAIADAWELALDRSRSAGRLIRSVETDIGPLVVFFERNLLVDVLVQVIENAAVDKHATTDRPSTGVALRVEAFRNGEGPVLIRVLNDTSRQSDDVGFGMAAYAERVQTYGATLEHGPAASGQEWTWEARLQVQPWESA